MNPTIARLDAAVSRLVRSSRREQLLLRWLLAILTAMVIIQLLG
jgi:hypothetical protein